MGRERYLPSVMEPRPPPRAAKTSQPVGNTTSQSGKQVHVSKYTWEAQPRAVQPAKATATCRNSPRRQAATRPHGTDARGSGLENPQQRRRWEQGGGSVGRGRHGARGRFERPAGACMSGTRSSLCRPAELVCDGIVPLMYCSKRCACTHTHMRIRVCVYERMHVCVCVYVPSTYCSTRRGCPVGLTVAPY